MKIALFTYQFYPKYGGISHTTTSLCKLFREKEHDLHIFNPYHKGKNIHNILDKNYYTIKDIYKFLKNKQLLYFLILAIWNIVREKRISLEDRIKMVLFLFVPKFGIKFTINLLKTYPYFKKIDFDVIFGCATGGFTLPLIFVLSRIFKKKVICLSHGQDFLIKRLISLKASYIKNLDKIILSNTVMKDLIKSIYNLPEDKLTIINRGIVLNDYEVKESKEELRRKLKIKDNCFVILSVGNHVKRKGFDLVIKAVDKIVKKDPNIPIKYYLIGRGHYTQKLKQITEELNLKNFIEFLGEIDDNERNRYYKLSDVFLMPSTIEKSSIEGFGITFLEANYFKLPVIGAATGGITEAIINGTTGLLVKPNDINDLTEKILFFYNQPEKTKEMGEEGYNRVINNYNWHKIYEEYIKVFRNVIQE
ncbi:MAG: glycosyltransferase family 4 protein [Promethearchaeota archaeon]